MLQTCARRLRAKHGNFWKQASSAAADFTWCPRQLVAVSHELGTTCNITRENQSQIAARAFQTSVRNDRRRSRQHDALSWYPQPLVDLTKTYVKRFVSEHFDTVIDPRFPRETGLPMTIYVSQKQDCRPASVEVHQFYGNYHNLSDIFSITIPRTVTEAPRIIGDTGAITLGDIAKVYRYIEINRTILLEVWEHGQDEANDVAWYYYMHLERLP